MPVFKALGRRAASLGTAALVIFTVATSCILHAPEAQAELVSVQASGYDTASTARSISTNTSYASSLLDDSDVDWYRFEAAQAGYVSLTFGKEYSTEGHGWTVTLYDGSASSSFRSWVFYPDNMNTDKTCSIGIPAGTYYVKVSRNWGDATTSTYNFKVNFEASGAWESEPSNDSAGTAQPVRVGAKCYGSTYNDSDVDWYRFEAAQAGYVSLTFGKEYSTEGHGWTVTLYDGSASSAVESWSFAPDDKKNDTVWEYLKFGTYYVKVSRNWGDATTSTYNFKLAKVTHVNSTKTTGVSSSCVYTGKAIKPIPTVKMGSKTLSKGIDYTVSYANNKALGKATITITGKGSYVGTKVVTFNIVPKKVTGVNATSTYRGQVTASWSSKASQKAGASGYQIYFKASNMKKALYGETGWVTSTRYAMSGFTPGKSATVKVRAYTYIDGEKAYGAWSASRTVKVKR